jgi:hypothetical protein
MFPDGFDRTPKKPDLLLEAFFYGMAAAQGDDLKRSAEVVRRDDGDGAASNRAATERLRFGRLGIF